MLQNNEKACADFSLIASHTGGFVSFYFYGIRVRNPYVGRFKNLLGGKKIICISSFRSHSNPFACYDYSRLQKVFHQL